MFCFKTIDTFPNKLLKRIQENFGDKPNKESCKLKEDSMQFFLRTAIDGKAFIDEDRYLLGKEGAVNLYHTKYELSTRSVIGFKDKGTFDFVRYGEIYNAISERFYAFFLDSLPSDPEENVYINLSVDNFRNSNHKDIQEIKFGIKILINKCINHGLLDLNGLRFRNFDFSNMKFIILKQHPINGADLDQNYSSNMIDMSACKFNGVRFNRSSFNNVDFSYSDFYNVNFQGGIIENTMFKGAVLNATSFDHCTIKDCIFNDCELSWIFLTNTVFVNTKFINCKISNINFCFATTLGLEFINTKVENVVATREQSEKFNCGLVNGGKLQIKPSNKSYLEQLKIIADVCAIKYKDLPQEIKSYIQEKKLINFFTTDDFYQNEIEDADIVVIMDNEFMRLYLKDHLHAYLDLNDHSDLHPVSKNYIVIDNFLQLPMLQEKIKKFDVNKIQT